MPQSKPKFKELTFDSEELFQSWLKENTAKIINLNPVFDITKIWVHSSGEILHCDFHGRIYNGKFINLKSLKIGSPLIIDSEVVRGLVVESIE